MTSARSKAYEYRFRFQLNPPRFLNRSLDFIFQSDYIAGLRGSSVDQG